MSNDKMKRLETARKSVEELSRTKERLSGVVETKKAEVDEAAEELVEEEDAAAGDEQEKESDTKTEVKKAESKKTETKEDTKEAAQKTQFVKIAKMTPQTKNWLKNYWANIYPPEYVEAILAEN